MWPETAAALLLARVETERTTLRKAAAEFFASHPELSYLKPVVRVLTLGVARNYRLLDYALSRAGHRRSRSPFRRNLARVLAFEVVFQGVRKPRLSCVAEKAGLREDAVHALDSLDIESERKNLLKEGRPDIAYSVPSWLPREIEESRVPQPLLMLESFLRDPVRWLRVSIHRIGREELAERLRARGIETTEDGDLSDVLRVVRGSGLGATPEYKSGLYVVQDKASALVAHLARGARTVVDVTGGAGVKATHAAQLGCPTGLAGDIDARRARSALELVRRLQLEHAVHVAVWDARLLPLRSSTERLVVIVDPTCSNLGRLGHEPELKMWLRSSDVKRAARLQRELLRRVLEALPRGVRVLYSVCSWSIREAERVVESVASLVEPREPPLKIGLGSGVKGAQRLYPHVHGTLGFFVAFLERV